MGTGNTKIGGGGGGSEKHGGWVQKVQNREGVGKESEWLGQHCTKIEGGRNGAFGYRLYQNRDTASTKQGCCQCRLGASQ